MHSHTVESIASTRKKTKETVRIESLFPDELRQNSAVLIDLLKDYYEHMNERGMPSYEIDSINEVRDIDSADYEYLSLIQKEIAFSVPRTVVADKVKLYKNLMRYYTIRGSTDSVELFFKILFSDNVEVYYPREDMLVPSSGTWDTVSRRPAKVKVFDQKQLMKFSTVIGSVTGSFNKGETVTGSEIGVTAIVDSYVDDVLTLKGIRIPSGYDPSLTMVLKKMKSLLATIPTLQLLLELHGHIQTVVLSIMVTIIRVKQYQLKIVWTM